MATAHPLAPYDADIVGASHEWNIDPNLLRALIMQESRGNPNARSTANAYGLTQIIPETAAALGVTNPKDPTQQIYAGAKYLNEGLAAEGNPEGALLYYHGGPNWRQNYGPESAGYVPGVIAHYQRVSQQYPSGPASSSDPAPEDKSTAKPASAADDDPFTAAVSAAKEQIKTAAPAPAPAAEQPAAAPGPAPGFVPGDDMPTMNVTTPARPVKASPASPALPAPPKPTGDPFTDAVNAAKHEVATTPAAAPAPTVPDSAPQPAAIDPITGFAVDPADPSKPVGGTVLAGKEQGTVSPGSAAPMADAVAGAKEGFGPGQIGLSDASKSALANAGVYNKPGEYNPLKAINEAAVNTLAYGGDLAARSANAVYRGVQAGVVGAGEQISPSAGRLARDVVSIPDAFAGSPDHFTTGAGGVAAGEGANALSAVADAHTDRLAAPLPQAFVDAPHAPSALSVDLPAAPMSLTPSNPLHPDNIATQTITASRPSASSGDVQYAPYKPPSERTPAPAADAGGSGAAPPAATGPGGGSGDPPGGSGGGGGAGGSGPSRRVQDAQRVDALHAKLNEAQPTGADRNQYVPGVVSSLADQEQTANLAREQKMLESRIPEEAKAASQRNSEARVNYLENNASPNAEIAQARDDRAEAFQQTIGQTWQNQQRVQPSEFETYLRQTMGNEDNIENTALQQKFSKYLDRLDAMKDENKTVSPRRLYSLTKDMDVDLDPLTSSTDAGLRRIGGELRSAKEKALDDVQRGVPDGSFQQARQQYAQDSAAIDGQQALRNTIDAMYGTTPGKLTLSGVQRAIRTAVKAASRPGANIAKSMTEDQWQTLFNVRDDLRRVASREEKARAAGSDTVPNLLDNLLGIGRSAGNEALNMALHAGAAHVAPIVGNIVIEKVRSGLMNRTIRKQQAKDTKRLGQILSPPQSGNSLSP